MKKLIISIIVAGLTLAGISDASARPRRMRPDAHSRPSGGIIEKAYSGNFLRVLDAQSAVSHEKVADMVRRMRWATLLPFETVSGKASGGIKELSETAKALLGEKRVGASMVIVDDATLPFRIFSDEGNWAILNVAFLKEDKPDTGKFEVRFEKMVWRALARALQVGSVTHMPSVLQPFRTLAELDGNAMMRPSPEGFNAFIFNARNYGIGTITISSYRDACHKGWAPPPANDVQKKIWDEIHALPTEPMKIKPETSKVSD